MSKSSNSPQKDIAEISTYQSGIAQASAHRAINRVVSDYLLQYGLTSMQWFILGHINDAGEGGLRISDVMTKVRTTLPYITNTIALLESKGMVRKVTHSGDSRIKLVSIDPEFAPNIDVIENDLREYLRVKLYEQSGISRDELNVYITVLYKIMNSDYQKHLSNYE